MGTNLKGKNIGKGFTQRKDGLYQARKKIKGHEICLYDTNLKRLQGKFKYECEKYENDPNNTNNIFITLDDLYNEWYKNVLLNIEHKESTKLMKVNAYNKIEDEYKHKSINSFIITDIDNILYSTRNNHNGQLAITTKALLNSMFDYAYKRKYITSKLDFSELTFSFDRSTVKKDLEIPTDNDINVILDNIHSKQMKIVTNLFIQTGIRLCELTGLTLKNIDLDKKEIKITQQLIYAKDLNTNKHGFKIVKPKTKKSIRTIPITDYCCDLIRQQMKLRESRVKNNEWNDLLFITKQGTPINSRIIQKFYYRLYDRIGNQLSLNALHPHLFRHYYATTLLSNNVNTRVIQTLLGHEKDDITQIYAHVTNENLHNSIQCLNKNVV